AGANAWGVFGVVCEGVCGDGGAVRGGWGGVLFGAVERFLRRKERREHRGHREEEPKTQAYKNAETGGGRKTQEHSQEQLCHRDRREEKRCSGRGRPHP